MDIHHAPRIISADRLYGAVIITFDDGRCAVYSASLLDAIFPQAQDVTELGIEDWHLPVPSSA